MRAQRSLGMTLAIAIALAACGGTSPGASATGGPLSPTAGLTDAPASVEPTDGAGPTVDPAAVLVPGTHIAMVPPDGFVASASFPGFEHPTGASILVAELPAPYDEVAPGMTDAGFAGQGVTVTERSEVTVDGRPGLLVRGTQSAQGLDFGKVLLVTGSGNLTAILNGNYPIAETAIGEAIEAAELTVSIDPERSIDPEEALTFTITPAPPLRFAGVFANGATYNTSGLLPAADKDEPVFVVSPSLGVPASGDLEAFALVRLQQLATVKDIQVESTEETTIAGRPAIVHVAKALRANRPGEVVVYQVMLGGDGDYVLMTGVCDEGRSAECLETFAATAATYEPRP